MPRLTASGTRRLPPAPEGSRRSWRDEVLDHEHPAAASNREHAVSTDRAANADDQRIASSIAEVSDACVASEFSAADHATGVTFEDLEHGPLLRCQRLEGVSIINRGICDGMRRSGPCHVVQRTPPA